MRRRQFLGVVSGAAVWPVAARAQQVTRTPRVGVLRVMPNDNRLVNPSQAAFEKALQEFGWAAGSNIQIDYRRAEPNDFAQMEAFAKGLLSLKPDVILAHTARVVAEFQRKTKNIPIVFVSVTDPVASGFVASMSYPGGNITGFSNFEPTLVSKHIEILKEISPGMTAVSEMFYPDNPDRHTITHPILEAAAQYHGVELISAPVLTTRISTAPSPVLAIIRLKVS